jgi:hypothetical protein
VLQPVCNLDAIVLERNPLIGRASLAGSPRPS